MFYLCVNDQIYNIVVGGSKSIFVLLIFQLHLYNGLNKGFLLIDAQIKKIRYENFVYLGPAK